MNNVKRTMLKRRGKTSEKTRQAGGFQYPDPRRLLYKYQRTSRKREFEGAAVV